MGGGGIKIFRGSSKPAKCLRKENCSSSIVSCLLDCVDASSPSRSLSSASPPAVAAGQLCGTPTPPSEPLPEEKNPEYLKELQAERDSLEATVTTEDAEKTNHAMKLLEQGKPKNRLQPSSYFM